MQGRDVLKGMSVFVVGAIGGYEPGFSEPLDE